MQATCSEVQPVAEMDDIAERLVELKNMAEESMEKQGTSNAHSTCIFNTAGMLSFMAALVMTMV